MIRLLRDTLVSRFAAIAAAVGVSLVDLGATAKKNDGGKDRRDNREDRDDGGRDRDQNRDRQRDGDNRRDDDGGDDNGNGVQRLRQRQANEGGDGAADADRGSVEGGQTADQTPTPVPVTTTTTTTVTDPGNIPPPTDTRASIEDPDGEVIAGFDPETQTLIARSGNVTASVGPDGPKVIIDDEEVVPVVEPPPADGGGNDGGTNGGDPTPTPDPSGGEPTPDFES